MKIGSDGFIDMQDSGRVRMPGRHDEQLDPLPAGEALAYLLSHAFTGARRIVRAPTPSERSALRRALWSGSVNERMGVVDRVWRAITEPVETPRVETDDPVLIQVVRYGRNRVYPLYLVEGKTRVLRPSENGDAVAQNGAPRIDLREETPAA